MRICSARVLNAPYRLGYDRRFHFARMTEMSHQREVLVGHSYIAKEEQQFVGVLIGDKPSQPETQRLGADPYCLKLLKREERRNITTQS